MTTVLMMLLVVLIVAIRCAIGGKRKVATLASRLLLRRGAIAEGELLVHVVRVDIVITAVAASGVGL